MGVLQESQCIHLPPVGPSVPAESESKQAERDGGRASTLAALQGIG